jgi:hypothetical protein
MASYHSRSHGSRSALGGGLEIDGAAGGGTTARASIALGADNRTCLRQQAVFSERGRLRILVCMTQPQERPRWMALSEGLDRIADSIIMRAIGNDGRTSTRSGRG